MDHIGQITNPQGMAIVWNYKDRITSAGAFAPNDVEQVIISTASLKSISTKKYKNKPDGTFELRLAPTFNWVARLTPGSWCAILMTKDETFLPTSPNLVPPATRETLKMFGRIHSVRSVVTVDNNGTRKTEYVVSGQDWGSIFNTHLYIDPIARNNNLDTAAAVGHAARLYLEQLVLSWRDSKTDKLPTPTDVVKGIIALWGNPIPDIESAFGGGATSPNILITSQAQFTLPAPILTYLKQPLNPENPKVLPKFAHLINVEDGVLTGKDKYETVDDEAFGFPNPNSFYGMNTFWQLLTANSNPAISELVTDFRWSGEGLASTPSFTLYRRIKPFITQPIPKLALDYAPISAKELNPNPFAADKDVGKLISKFQDIRHVDIALEDVINIHAGTNWRDNINFVEIRPQPQLNQTNHELKVKLSAQTTDLKAIERDGFKPLIQKVDYIPYDSSDPAPLAATKWKYLMREWYFNTHNMLNGACTIIGQNEYIGVGDNIRIPIRVLGDSFINSGQLASLGSLLTGGPSVFLLAHVESVSNSFSVSEEGARSFKTTIEFSRGIVVSDNGLPLAFNSNGALDQDASLLPSSQEKLGNVFGTSTENDPDKDKLKGT